MTGRICLALALLAACGSHRAGSLGDDGSVDASGAHDGATGDGGTISDGGTTGDGGTISDGGTTGDGGSTGDASITLDAGPLDAGPSDGGVITPDAPPVSPTAPYELVAAGAHMCSLRDGTLRCWGLNDMGQLGITSTQTCSNLPCTKSPAVVLSDVAKVSVGQRTTCAIKTDKTLWCWGDSRQRQLGITPQDLCTNNEACVKTPTQVPNLANVVEVAVGATHTCALLEGGTVQCTGANSVGELGNGTTAQGNVFAAVPTITTAIGIRVGANFSCAILADRTLSCWGHNQSGQLGRGTMTCSTCTSAQPVIAISDVRELTLGARHACAITGDLGVWCWGSNQIGQGTGNEICTGSYCSKTPKRLVDHTAFEIDAGAQHTCSRNLDNTVDCWGSDFAGQIGIQPFPPDCATSHPCARAPTLVTGTANVRRLALGDGNSCTLLADGTGQCWGSNAGGQYGDGSVLSALTPLAITTW